jgi:hypothetical protein
MKNLIDDPFRENFNFLVFIRGKAMTMLFYFGGSNRFELLAQFLYCWTDLK